jgi:hypothetical protein
MQHATDIASSKLVRTVKNWHCARAVFSEFIAAHPELGLKDSPVTFRNFCYRHGRALMSLGVMRKPAGLRSPAIFDAQRFDQVAFELVTLRSIDVPLHLISAGEPPPIGEYPITKDHCASKGALTSITKGENHGGS